ncbi:hypothetical protein NL108_016000 [Boleophthalmus pectinirostris]|nr:hypothetical protein NL108_016000 [Boleophthalmus pectinirostris]
MEKWTFEPRTDPGLGLDRDQSETETETRPEAQSPRQGWSSESKLGVRPGPALVPLWFRSGFGVIPNLDQSWFSPYAAQKSGIAVTESHVNGKQSLSVFHLNVKLKTEKINHLSVFSFWFWRQIMKKTVSFSFPYF